MSKTCSCCGNTKDLFDFPGDKNQCKDCYKQKAIVARELKPPEYSVWRGMKERCNNKNHVAYHRYGGRGISVCDEWKYSFDKFISDVGKRPSLSHTLERNNNDEGYNPQNVSWATPKEQGRNRHNNVAVIIDGEKKTVSELEEEYNISSSVLKARITAGYTSDKLLGPVNERSKLPRNAPHSKYHLVEYDGKMVTVSNLSEITGIGLNTLKGRVKRGDVGEELIRPVK